MSEKNEIFSSFSNEICSDDVEINRFIKFVQTQIEKLQQYTQLGTKKEITFNELNSFLLSYNTIFLSLVGIYNIAKIEYLKEQEDFDNWFSEKFIIIRNRENPKELSATKWASQKEIEYMVRQEYKSEYVPRKSKLLLMERKASFFRRLIDIWTSQQYILSTLSKNLQTELSLSSFPDSIRKSLIE